MMLAALIIVTFIAVIEFLMLVGAYACHRELDDKLRAESERRKAAEELAAEHERDLESLRRRCMKYVRQRIELDYKHGVNPLDTRAWFDVEAVPLRSGDEDKEMPF